MPEGFAEVVNRIAAQRDVHFILLTGPGEESIRDDVKAKAVPEFLEPETSESGLSRLKGLIARLDLLICNDSGPRHIAVAFECPIVCIMGPTSPRYTDSPYEIGEVLRLPLECSPCQKPVCPLEHHRCMRDVTPEQVAEAALRVLQITHCPDKD
jgi:heptosyltransferase-2